VLTNPADAARLVLPEPGLPNPQFARPASAERVERATQSLNARGFPSEIVDSREEARRRVLSALPEGAEVHSALSETMRELGITTEIDESGRYQSVRKRLMQFDRATQFREMQKMAAAPDYMVGSANAVTEYGDILVGSGSGSQIGAYAYAAGHVILVVGHQKIVRDVAEGMRRIREYCVPLEFERMRSIGRQGTVLAKTLILHAEFQGRVRVILIRDVIGF
jgi:hypothetical protein